MKNDQRIILGIHVGHDSGAALIQDGRIIAGAPEERFNRQKITKKFPTFATKYCLNFANIE